MVSEVGAVCRVVSRCAGRTPLARRTRLAYNNGAENALALLVDEGVDVDRRAVVGANEDVLIALSRQTSRQ